MKVRDEQIMTSIKSHDSLKRMTQLLADVLLKILKYFQVM